MDKQKTNYLIGRAELLTYDIEFPKSGGPSKEVYTLSESINRIKPQIDKASEQIEKLNALATPDGQTVCSITMHPNFYAKSYFPKNFIREYELEFIGDKPKKVLPDRWRSKETPKHSPTTEIFLSVNKSQVRKISDKLNEIAENSALAKDVQHIWSFDFFDKTQKIKINDQGSNNLTESYEIAIQYPSFKESIIKETFLKFATQCGVEVHKDLLFNVANLSFYPVNGSLNSIKQLAEFSFVRVVRKIPSLRDIVPTIRSTGFEEICQLPDNPPLSTEPKVAILDGGLPDKHNLDSWIKSSKKMDNTADSVTDYIDHGMAVTSAFLFGAAEPGQRLAQPYSYVDHLRILDSKTEQEDPLELFRTLGFIEEILLSGQYDFINLSLGPDLPIEDDDIHVWTSVIDDLLKDGSTLMTVAIGNNGQLDSLTKLNRIQVPSDCVNALSVGACNTSNSDWKKASYSAVGPGRAPGLVKPDLVSFGGSHNEYFHVLNQKLQATPTQGTSFASPLTLRSAVGVRSILGRDISLIAIKALLIHSTEPHKTEGVDQNGWGKLPNNLSEIIATGPGEARIVYQGELKPGKLLRAPIPLPEANISGNVKITATFCYTTDTEPHCVSSYSQSGLTITFRPDKDNYSVDKTTGEMAANPKSDSFFSFTEIMTEAEMRADSGKWANVLHKSKTKRGTSLNKPVFDIHYQTRDGGGPSKNKDKLQYALIITLEAPNQINIHDEIVEAFSSTLVEIEPQVAVPEIEVM